MTRGRGSAHSEWVPIAAALAMVRKTGKRTEEAIEILLGALAAGTLIARADHIRTVFSDGVDERRNHIVLPDLWTMGPPPPPGHRFWMKGDVLIVPQPLPAGSRIWLGGQLVDLPFGGNMPTFAIRGLSVSREGLFSLCRSLGSDPGRGRRRGSGSLAAMDEPFVLEIRRMLEARTVSSITEAASHLADSAPGHGAIESKIKRLVKRYKQRFPER